MYAIKMNEDKSLMTTVKSKIYQNEKNADTLVFLVPMHYEDKNIAECTVILRYILPNKVGRSEELEMCPEPYKDYYQYRLKVSSTLTNIPGKIELWLSIIDANDDLLMKSDNIFVTVYPTKDITRYLSPNDRNQLDKLSEKVAQLEMRKADNIFFDEDEQYLQLTSNGSPIGDKVNMTAYVGGEIIEFDKDSDDADGDKDHDGDDGCISNDSIIYF